MPVHCVCVVCVCVLCVCNIVYTILYHLLANVFGQGWNTDIIDKKLSETSYGRKGFWSSVGGNAKYATNEMHWTPMNTARATRARETCQNL